MYINTYLRTIWFLVFFPEHKCFSVIIPFSIYAFLMVNSPRHDKMPEDINSRCLEWAEARLRWVFSLANKALFLLETEMSSTH